MKNQTQTPKTKGFTLIELIVVIGIIGLLASVVTASLGKSRSKAEVAKVLSDYRAVSNAIELYRQSNNNTYPGTEAVPLATSDLVENYLSSYLQQKPTVSPLVVEGQISGSDVYYYLNPVDPGGRYWCGNDTTNMQDYVLYFEPTTDAEDSGLFETLRVEDGTPVANTACILVNQL